jgi:hypothetical protein
VTHIGEALALTHQAMSGDRLLPDTAAKARLLYGFMEGKRAVRQLITDDRRHALVQIKLRSGRPDDSAPVLAAVRRLVDERPRSWDAARQRAAVLARLRAIAAREGLALPDLEAELAAARPPVPTEAVTRGLVAFLESEEFLGDLPQNPLLAAATVAALGPSPKDLPGALAPLVGAEAAPALAADLDDALAEIWRREEARALATTLFPPRLVPAAASALLGLSLAPSGTPEIAASVTGLPVMNQGLSRSVAKNQLLTLVVALAIVCLVTTLLARSLRTGVLAALPTIFTVAVMYAAMRLLGITLDLGTSLLASLTIGAGMSHAIHLLSAWDAPDDRPLGDAARAAMATAGPGVLTNTLMVASGFFVLTLGEARPLRNVGALIAVAIVVAAVSTLLLIPALARKHRYGFRARPRPEPADETVMSPERTP